MFIQKIFHVHRDVEETRSALANTQAYRRNLEGVSKAVITADGVGQFDCVFPDGFRAHFVLIELPTEDPNELLFRSTAGNMEISGLVEFIPIRDHLTEVQVTLEYSYRSPVHTLLDAVTNATERFINRQLARLQACLDGVPLPDRDCVPRIASRLPQLAH